METNDGMMRALDRIALDVQALREDMKAQSERLAAQSERLAAQSERLAAQDGRSAAIEAALVRLHRDVEAGIARPHRDTDARLDKLHREVFGMGTTFAIMGDRVGFAALEEAEHSGRIVKRLHRIDNRLESIDERLHRLYGRMGGIERAQRTPAEPQPQAQQ